MSTIERCPFCFREINKPKTNFEKDPNAAKYYFDLGRKNNLEKYSVFLASYFVKHNRERSKYTQYWRNNYEITEIKAASGLILQLRALLESAEDEKNDTVSFDQESNQFKFKNESERHNDDYNVNVSKEIPVICNTEPKALVCPHCENFLPLNYFDVPCYSIILAGSSHVGKTLFTMALFMNNFKNIVGNCQKVQITPALRDCDSETAEFYRKMQEYSTDGWLPPGTTRPLPPLFLNVTWNLDAKRKFTHNVCLVDTQGEDWERMKNNKNDITAFIESCDGLINLIEPNQGSYGGNNTYIGEELEAAIADENAEYVNPIADDVDSAIRKNKFKPTGKASEVFDMFNELQNKINRVAIVLNKLDKYLDGGDFCDLVSTEEIPFWNDLITTYKNPSARDKFFDYDELEKHCLAAYSFISKYFRITDAGNTNSFPKLKWFAVSSMSGNPEKVDISEQHDDTNFKYKVNEGQALNTYNIHEPFLWILCDAVAKDLAKV